MGSRAEATDRSAYAFLFNTSDPAVPADYGEHFLAAFSLALELEQADPDRETTSLVLTGDLLFSRIGMSQAWKTLLGGVSPHRLGQVARRIFADTLALDPAHPDMLSRSSLISAFERDEIIYSITILRMSPVTASCLHTCMSSVGGYLGAVMIERQGRHIRALLIDELVHTAFVEQGLLKMSLSRDL